MDVITVIKGVKNINDYVAVTQDLASKFWNPKIECSMSMVHTLKSIRSLEIEYFNKRDDNGAAIIVFERLLVLPPSKAWNMLGKELVALIKYWLDTVRKHLVNHHPHWWSFVKRLLRFVKELIKKDHAIHNILVEHTAECFLDLATRSRLDLSQRHAVLYTFNIFCAESSKEIRSALRTEFKHYFIRLATIMATCGHLPSQYSIMETLLRWLVPRHDPAERRDAANKWFPPHLYSRQAVEVFIDRPWKNFNQDARDFLNAHNEMSGLVTSVVCRKLTVGDEVLVPGAESLPTWLDINVSEGCVSVQLEPADGAGGGGRDASETLTVAGDATLAAKLCRKSMDVTIILETSEPPQLFPSDKHLLGAGKQQVQVVISSRSDMARVDNALRAVFHDNYEVLLDFEEMFWSPTLPDLSRDKNTKCPRTTEDAKPRNQSGYRILRSAKPFELKTPDVTKSNKNVTTKTHIQPSVMSPITEVHNEVSDIVKYSSPQTPRKNEVDNKLLRRKRKLYSPKDDYVMPDNENQIDANLNILSDNQDDLPLSEIRKSAVTPESTIGSYKEFENELVKYKRLRSRKSKGKAESPILSPKTKKNNFKFDKLKENIDTRVKITLAAKACDNDIAIYNFTSDSEDEDFINYKNALQKRISTATVDSGNSFISTRRGKMRKVDYVKSNTAKYKTSTPKCKRPAKRGNGKSNARAVNVNPVIELEDERIRDTIQEELNTSLLIENPKKNIECEELNPAILAQVELIIENDVHNVIKKINQTIAEKKKSTKKIEKTIKKEKAVKHIEAEDKCGDRTISPLPGFIVETAPAVQKVADDSLNSNNMLQKMKKLYQEGPDAVNDISISNTSHNLLPNAERTNLNVQIINDIIGDDNFRFEDVIVDKKQSSFFAKNNPKEKALSKICDIENVNSKSYVKSNDEIGEINSLKDVKITKNPPKKRTLQLKSKKKIYKSTVKDVTATEKSQTCPVLPNNVVERNKENKYAEKSHERIDTTNRSIEIFCIDDSKISNKIHSKLVLKPIETIDILDTVAEMKSEKSIATVGITGHGDVSEEPTPSLKALNENFVPREFSMNDSTKESYVKLHKNINDWNDFLSDNDFNVEINDSYNGRNESSNTTVQGRNVISPEKRSDGISKLISKHKPEISMKVNQESKSLYDCSKWLPSNKDSDSASASSEVSKSAKKSPVGCIQRLSDEVFKFFPINDYNVPIQKYANLASNYEKHKEKKANKEGINTSPKGFNKRLTTISSRDSVSEASDSNEVSKSRKSPILCFERLFSDLSKFRNNNDDSLEKFTNVASNYDKYSKKNEAKSINNTSPKDSSERLSIISPRDSDSEASDNTKVSKNNKSPDLGIKILPRDLFKRSIDSPYSSKRLSMISPIKLYGDEETTRTKRKFQDDSSEDVTVKRNKNASSKSYQSVVKTPPQMTYLLRNIPHRSIDTSPDSTLSSSTRLDTSRTADKHISSKGAKTRKPDDSNTGQEGFCGDNGQSLSCVEDWLQTQPAPNRDQNLIDVVQSVMEKLDILLEKRNNSYKKFIHTSFMKEGTDCRVHSRRLLQEPIHGLAAKVVNR